MAPPLEQPRAGSGLFDGVGVEDTSPMRTPSKRARISAADEHTFALAKALRDSNYDQWLEESKTRWRSLRKKLKLMRTFVKLEGEGNEVDVEILASSAEIASFDLFSGKKGRRKGHSLTRWKSVKPNEIRISQVPELQSTFKKLLQMALSKGEKGGMKTGKGNSVGEPMERENLEDSDDDDSDDVESSDQSGSDDDVEHGLGLSSDDEETRQDQCGMDTQNRNDNTVPDPMETTTAAPQGSAADALAAYGDVPLPPPTYAPAPGVVALKSSAHAAAAAAMPPPQSRHPLAPQASGSDRDATNGALSALAAYGGAFDATIVAPNEPGSSSRNPEPATLGNPHLPGVHQNPYHDPWGGKLIKPHNFSGRSKEKKPFVMDEGLVDAKVLAMKRWTDLSLEDVAFLLKETKFLISRRRKAHKGGRSRNDDLNRAEFSTRVANDRRRPVRPGGRPRSNAEQLITIANSSAFVVGVASGATSNAPLCLPVPHHHQCIACARVFDMPHKLHDHMHEHAGTAPHQCIYPGCARVFANRASLSRHRRVHENKHVCSFASCGKSFPTDYALKAHSKVHSNDRPCACLVAGCGKAFKDEKALSNHARVHTGEKPFKCGEDGLFTPHEPGCGMRFGYKIDLKRHRERCKVVQARGEEMEDYGFQG